MVNVNRIIEVINSEKPVSPPLRVGSYSRVSTRNESQKDSCDNQLKTINDYINDHNNMIMLPETTFVDDGISGKCVTNRPGYLSLMNAVENRAIDIIIVKTCSRLFRSTLDAQLFLNALLKNNVFLLTLDENKIWDFNNQSDVMMFAIRSVFDASVSKTQSDAGKLVQERRIRDKKLSSKDVVPGFIWNKEKGAIEIDETVSQYIVLIFEEYVYRNGTPSSIYKLLKEQNITFPKNKRNKKTRESYIAYDYLSERIISRILVNPKYVGLFHINKVSSTYIGGNQPERYKIPKEDWVLIERPDLAIIDPDLFQMAQRIRESRINTYDILDRKTSRARFQGTHIYAGKIFCPICHHPYQFGYADRKGTIPIYRIKNHSMCPNSINRISEEDLKSLTKKALSSTISQQDKLFISLENILKECVESSHINIDEVEDIKRDRDSLETQINSLIDSLSKTGLSDSVRPRIESRINEINDQITMLNKEIEFKEANHLDDTFVFEKMALIKDAIKELRNFNTIDKERVNNYIDRIEIAPDNTVNMSLKSGCTLSFNHSESEIGANNMDVGTIGQPPAPH